MFHNNRNFFIAILFLLVTALFFQVKTNFFNDISVEAVNTPQVIQKNNIVKDPVYLLTYADGHDVFFQNQNMLALSALNKGIDYIHNYHRSLLEPDFVHKYQSILNQKRGAGYWLWKPYIIAKTLDSIPENSIIIYADSGCIFHHNIEPLLSHLKSYDMIFMRWDKGSNLKVENIAKRDLLIAMDCDTPQCRQAIHVWAAFMVLRNTPRTRAFIAKWFNYCCIEKNLTDTLSQHKEYDDFEFHHHDEAILSLMYFKDPADIKIIPSKEFNHYLTWHHRHPTHERFSLQNAMKKNP